MLKFNYNKENSKLIKANAANKADDEKKRKRALKKQFNADTRTDSNKKIEENAKLIHQTILIVPTVIFGIKNEVLQRHYELMLLALAAILLAFVSCWLANAGLNKAVLYQQYVDKYFRGDEKIASKRPETMWDYWQVRYDKLINTYMRIAYVIDRFAELAFAGLLVRMFYLACIGELFVGETNAK